MSRAFKHPVFKPRFSQAARRLSQSSSELWQVHNDALQRVEAGEDIIILSVGDPDLPTIERIIEHAVTRLYRGRTHYSPGMGELHLRETIADIETQASGKPTSPDEVIIFPGATNALFTVLSVLLDPDDEIIVSEPSYLGYEGIFDAIGCRVTRVPASVDSGFQVEIDAIENAVKDTTRVVLVNTPGNPAGNMMTRDQLVRLSRFCLDRNIWLVSDEVYSMITFEQRHVSARTAAARLDNVIVVDGLSKSHAMTGWRLGWAVAPEAVIPQLLNHTSATVFGCSQFIQDAAAFAMQNDGDYIRTITQEYRERRDYACDRVANIDGLSCQKPEAGMFLMIDVSQIAPDGQAFARRLLDDARVSVLPGAAFGKVTEKHIRLSLTQNVSVLEIAFDRIEAALK